IKCRNQPRAKTSGRIRGLEGREGHNHVTVNKGFRYKAKQTFSFSSTDNKLAGKTRERERTTVVRYQSGREGLLKMIGRRAGMNRVVMRRDDSFLTRFVDSVFYFFRLAEFEILFVLFILITYVIFKDLTARPEYNRILVDKPGGSDVWPF
ncbi:hypothetical protein EUTSA_v10021919mg, partial [Eutrema salsugineum]